MLKEIVIGREAYDKIMYYVHKTKFEISGFGNVQVIDGIPTVTDIFLIDQVNEATETEMDGDAIAKAMYDHHVSGMKGEMKFWWHSHVDMGVFWSGTDKDTIKSLTENGWFIHGVFNKKNECRIAYSNNDPVSVFVDNLGLTIDEDLITDETLAEKSLAIYLHEEEQQKLTDEFEIYMEQLKLTHEKQIDTIGEKIEPLLLDWENHIANECDALYDAKVKIKETKSYYKSPYYNKYNHKKIGLVEDYWSDENWYDDTLNWDIGEGKNTKHKEAKTQEIDNFVMLYNNDNIDDPFGGEELMELGFSLAQIEYAQSVCEVFDFEDMNEFEMQIGQSFDTYLTIKGIA